MQQSMFRFHQNIENNGLSWQHETIIKRNKTTTNFIVSCFRIKISNSYTYYSKYLPLSLLKFSPIFHETRCISNISLQTSDQSSQKTSDVED